MSISFSYNILLHIFYIAVAIFSLWSFWIWTAHTFTYFIWLKIVPGFIFSIAVALELVHCGFLSFG